MRRYNHTKQMETNMHNISANEMQWNIVPSVCGSGVKGEYNEDCFSAIGKYYLHRRPEDKRMLC
jgi:hypothetical protein